MAKKIMIVEDEPMVLSLIEAVLGSEGYDNVCCFNNPVDALSAIEQGERPALIVSDYNMPKMNGVVFLNTVRTLFPDMQALIVTGDPGALSRDDMISFPVLEKGGMNFHTRLITCVAHELELERLKVA